MKRRSPTSPFVPLSLWFLVACSAPPPPYADLSLRDALGADPAVIADLPADEQARIGDRFEQQRTAEADQESVPLDGPSTPQEALRAMDETRRANGDDALVVARLSAHGGALGVESTPGAAVGALVPVALPPLEGEPATTTQEAEARGLDGRAGQIVSSVLQASEARRLVRVTQWPTAVVAVDGVVYVNGSWLVAMGAREPRDAGKPRGVVLGAPIFPPVTITPQSLRGSPFATYPTLAACVADVTARCEACLSGGACDSSTSLSDFSSSQSECAFLVNDGGSQQSIQELCVLALTSIATVTQCVEADGCVPPPSNDDTVAGLTNADSFLSNDTCVRSLNLCLSGQNEPLDAGPSGTDINVNVNGCLGPFQACSSMFEALGDACSKGNCSGHGGPSCSSCNGCAKCSSCSSDTRTGAGTGYGSTGTGQNPHQGGSTSSGGGSGSGGSGGSSGSSGSSSGSSSGTSGSGSGSTSSGGSSSGVSSSGGTSSGGGSSGSGCSPGCTGGGSSGAGATTCASCSSCNGCSGCSNTSGGSSSSSSGSGGSSCQGCGGGSGSSSGGGGSSSSNSCNNNKCEMAVARGAPPEPPVSLLWMALPVLYLGRSARRAWSRS